MSLLRWVAAALLICAFSCSHKTPEEQLVKSIDAAVSWVPALQMTAEKWAANSVPSRFTSNAAQAAQKEFENSQKNVAKSKAARELRERIAADLREADDFAGRLDRAASRQDPRAIIPAIPILQRVKADLDAIQKQYGGGS